MPGSIKSDSGVSSPHQTDSMNSILKSKLSFQLNGKVSKQNTSTSELTMMSGKNSVSGSLNPSAFNSTNSISMQHNSHGENEDSNSIKSQHSIKNIDSPKQSDSLQAWKAPSNMADVERLTQLLSHYEEANKNQQAEIDYYRGTYDRNVKKIAEQEKTRLQLTKKIKQLENTMKFDKIAADGIKKKYNLLELEVREVKYSKDTAMSDLAQSRAQVSELMEQLDEDRSNRLKLMHENDRLSKLNKNLMTLQSTTANDNVSVNLGLLEKIQQIETLLAINKINSDTIQGQSQEIVLLTDEVYALKQAALATSTTIMDHDAVSDELLNHITILQNEVYRLRKGLLINTASDKVAAFTNASTTARLTNIITAKVKDFPDGSGKLYDVPTRHLAPLQTPHTGSASWSSTGRSRREGACSPIAESTADINSSSFFSAAERITSPDQLLYGSSSSHDIALPRLSSPLEDSVSSPQRNNRSYYCDNNKTNFDSQRPYSVAIGVQQNLERAQSQQQQRNTLKNREVSSSSGSGGRKSAPSMISPVASLHRPHNADALKSTYIAALDETGGQTVAASTGFIGSGVGVDESLQRSLMLDLIHHSDNHVAVHKVLSSYGRGGKRPSTVASKTSGGNNNNNTVSNNSSGSGMKVDLSQSMNDLKKCYSTNSVKNARLALSSSGTGSTVGPHSSHSFRELSPAAQYNQRSQLASMSSSAISLNLHHKSSGDVTGDHFPMVNLDTTLPAPNSKRSTNKKKTSNNTNSAKSLFVSSGLGMKHNVALDAELSSISKGSTKDMLKKILGDRDFECDP